MCASGLCSSTTLVTPREKSRVVEDRRGDATNRKNRETHQADILTFKKEAVHALLFNGFLCINREGNIRKISGKQRGKR